MQGNRIEVSYRVSRQLIGYEDEEKHVNRQLKRALMERLFEELKAGQPFVVTMQERERRTEPMFGDAIYTDSLTIAAVPVKQAVFQIYEAPPLELLPDALTEAWRRAKRWWRQTLQFQKERR